MRTLALLLLALSVVGRREQTIQQEEQRPVGRGSVRSAAGAEQGPSGATGNVAPPESTSATVAQAAAVEATAEQPGAEAPQQETPLPPEIQQAATMSELRPYLQSADRAVREDAVRRIAQMARAEGLGPITKAFWREPDFHGLGANDVRVGILLALAQVGGEEAKRFVFEVLRKYEKRGPSDEKYIYSDGEYASVVEAGIRALGAWGSDPAVYDRLRRIALEGSRRRFHWGMREEAYKGVVREEMRRAGLRGREQEAEHLVGGITSLG
jgi:hypothetical protein